MPEKIPSNCPKCGSTYIQIYDVNPRNQRNIYFCNKCENVWSEDKKLLEYKGKFNIKQLKEERKQFNYLGKIKSDDVVNVIIDLFIIGGKTFYVKKIRYKRRKR